MAKEQAVFFTMAAIREANKAAGYYWFSRDTMKWHRSKIVSRRPIYGRFFITSEGESIRKYSIREAQANGGIKTIGEYMGYSTSESALSALKEYYRSCKV